MGQKHIAHSGCSLSPWSRCSACRFVCHADACTLLVDGVLVAAGNLINGSTITRNDASELDELEFFHIELQVHDVLYAEGAPCETLLNVDENAANFAEYLRQRLMPLFQVARFSGGTASEYG